MLEPSTLFLTLAGVFVIAFMKGSFGGGFAIIGIPLLALVMDPLTAGALLAPLFVAMDVFALRYWKPATWSKPDLALLLPGLVAGIVAGTLLLSVMDGRAIAIIIALTTLVFAGLWFSRRDVAATARTAASSVPVAAHEGVAVQGSKAQLTSQLAIWSRAMSKAAAAGAVDAVFAAIGDALVKGESVAIAGFGSFSVKSRGARQGRNPRTGEAITIAPSKVPSFKAGKTLRDAVG